MIFLNFLKRIEKYSVIIIPQKLKGFFKKTELSLSFGVFSCGYLKITACLARVSHSFKRVSHSFKKALSVP
ncbi:hypothetical protein EXS95_02395 [Helicobacter pylori]|uniref:hypothetical protein n=1 Tax=Helicobacter pylori TaxID=210 RepID=UPI003133CDE6|nr:hypothetical protein [Helicobacter pylori]